MAPSVRTEVIRGVRELAVRHRWKAVEDLAANLLSADRGEAVVLVPGSGIETAPLRKWIRQVTARRRVAQIDIDQTASSAHPVLSADKLIAVFECGRLLTAPELRMLAEQFLPRPLETFAIVFTGAERLETREDLELAERAIWRVLVSGANRDWRRQDLLGCQCYLWSSAQPVEFLRDRCARDGARLAALLRRQTGDADAASLDHLAVIRLLELATAHLSTVPKPDEPDIASLGRRREELAQLRQRLARRLADGTLEVGRAAVATLLKAEPEIVRCVEAACSHPAAARNAVRTLSIGSAARLGCPPPLEAALRAWHTRLEAELNERVSAVAADMRALLEQVQCGLADSRVADHRRLATGLEPVSIDVPRVDQGTRSGKSHGLLAAEAATAVSGVMALSAGMIAAFIVSAVLSAALALHRTRRSLDHSRRLLRLAVHDVTERAVPEVRAAVQAAINGYGERLIEALRETEAELEAACDRARVSRKAILADLSDHKQLVEYRCRL
ncbi:MAG: hypothetical protein ACREVO_11220 [Steroidobacteraceae bacterium]